MGPHRVLFSVAVCVIGFAAACSSTSTPGGPGPGSTPPGQACALPKDCGCWQCNCEGVGGQPGAAQLCVSGHCPTGEEACTPSCAAAGAKVTSATVMGTCVGVP